jgi:hypothetical protein
MVAGQRVRSYLGDSLTKSSLKNTCLRAARIALPCAFLVATAAAQQTDANAPPRVQSAHRFLAQRSNPRASAWTRRTNTILRAQASGPSGMTTAWQPVGPQAIASVNYGLTTGRITSLALDPADPTGNHLLVGTTGGGVWAAQNAASGGLAQIVFNPLTDAALPQIGFTPPTISIGALSFQPGGTGVILAGTGDPNDALDSYYGDGVLRSVDNGRTWTRIESSADSTVPFSFVGLGFAGFAWSTTSTGRVVAAVSRAYQATSVGAETSRLSYAGLYYSSDAGATWRLSEIKDQNGIGVQGPLEAWAGDDGNAVTAVVWNPIRHVFIAALQFHGYYSSPDGITWTRLAAQPGANLTTALCPTNHGLTGSTGCPIFRGALTVNPNTGDTLAWTVDANNQDQGLWQDVCAPSGGSCTNTTIAFGRQWSTTGLEANTWQGRATILNGDYNLALAAIPSGQDTLLFAGGNDLWKCSLAMGCVWRNTTNANSCLSAAVAPYQHAIEWNPANPQEVFVGNDGGLWRSMDAVNETGSPCSSADASHWQNLNGALGSLAEIESMSAADATTLLAGFGANGTAGVSGGSTVPAHWPQILGGEGGPVAIDPANPLTWYVNNGAGVSIHVCTRGGSCTSSDFGASPTIGNSSVNSDGNALYAPAPFLLDPLDDSQLIVGTCRVWRGPASGNGWTTSNAVSSMFDGNFANQSCHGNALVRSLAAMPLAGGGEVVYAGMYGHEDGGATVAGHVFRGVMNTQGTWTWQDLTQNPVANLQFGFNAFHYGVSSIYIDPSDNTGNTLYVTLAALRNADNLDIVPLYRSTDGGAHWTGMESNLPNAPANAVVVDPANSNVVYVANDTGVFVTQTAATCGDHGVDCWSAFGTGLPQSPVVALNLLPSAQTLLAGTYGRGIWQIPLLGASAPSTTASVQPASLEFVPQVEGTNSAAFSVVLTNTGAAPLLPASVATTGDFSETDNCLNNSIAPGGKCTIQVTSTPGAPSSRTGQLTIQANIPGVTITVPLSGTGLLPGVVYFVPASLDLGSAQVGSRSANYSVMVENSSSSAIGIQSLTTAGPFSIVSNACGSSSLPANSDCQLLLQFAPTVAGPATGTITLVDNAGTQTAQLRGIGTAPPTDTLSTGSLAFPDTVIGQPSSPLTVRITNSGANSLTAIQPSVSGPFSFTSNCTTQLIGGSSCTVGITFTPTGQGTQTGVLTISDAIRTQTVSLSGIGLLPPVLAANPVSLSFGGQPIGKSSAPLSVTLSNTGGASLAGLGLQITGANPAAFNATLGTCSSTLAAGASCASQVVFAPSVAGSAAATLTASSSTPGVTPVSISLTGTGLTTAAFGVSPAQLTFAGLPVGVPSAPQAVTLTNNGGSSADGLALSIGGPFTLAQNGCGASLPAATSCTAAVVFTPTQNGAAAGELTVHSSNISPDATVALVGTGGLTNVLQAQPGSIAFPVTGVGSSSNTVAITLTNTSAAYALQNLSLAASSGFQVTSTCGASLPVGGSCASSLTFTPATAGAASGTLTVSSSTLAASAAVPLSGTGFDFTFGPGSGSTTQTVASGQTANYTLNLSAGATGATFTLACSSLPQYANCVFTPSTSTVAANGTATETIQITTSQSTGALQPGVGFGGKPLMLACGLILLPLFARRRRALFSLLAVVCVLAVFAAGCAGGGGGTASTPPSSSTHTVAPGTYSVQVQATANGLQHAVTLKLIVN